MTILSIIAEDAAGQVGIKPRKVSILSTDSLATITTSGYLNNTSLQGTVLSPTDIIWMVYGYSPSTGTGTFAELLPTFNNGIITLSLYVNTGNVLLPVNSGDIAVFNGTTGQITGTANIVSDYQQFVGLESILAHTAGAWSIQRNGAGDYINAKTPAADSSVTGFDITPQLRAAANKGFRLQSIDVIYDIGVLAVTTHTGALYSVSYTNNAANVITNIPLTGSLSTAVQTFSYLTNLAVTTPAFLNVSAAKYVFEISLVAAATSAYAQVGLNLHFSKTIN